LQRAIVIKAVSLQRCSSSMLPVQDRVSLSMDEELQSIDEKIHVMPQTRRPCKKLACAVAVVATALVSVSVYRKHAGAVAAREDDVVIQDTMKVRVPYEHCAKHFTDCTQSHCCKGTNIYCWQTNKGTGMCQKWSSKGWPGKELEGPNTLVPVDPIQMGNSLFCFTAYRVNKGTSDADDNAYNLLLAQKKYGAGIFGCEMWRVYSDVDANLDDYNVIKVSGNDFFQKRRLETGGWGGNQWVNTPFFRQVWKKIYEEYPQGGFSTKQWVVKTDPDTLFLPARLTARLQSQPVPKTGLYLEHCKGVSFGFFGSLEVMSKTAALILFQNLDNCYTKEIPWKDDWIARKYGWYGEDLFAQRCMDRHGVKKIWQFDLVTDGTCPEGRPWGKKKEKKWIPDPVTCSERDTSVAFKPLKFSDKYFACLSAINGGRTYV